MRRPPLIRPVALAALLALAAAACSPGPAKTTADDDAFGRQVRAYLLKHPEVIEEAGAKLNEQRRAQALAAASTAIAGKRMQLEADPADYVANPSGKITVVEFFDYRCPYCKAAQPDLKGLIANNKDIRFVFKQFPILPDADGKLGVSLRAARAAMAAQAAGKYLPVHDALMSARPLDDAAIAKAMKDNGLDPLPAVASTAYDRRIKAVHDLAVDIGATGTPSFVVGDALIEGNQMDVLAAAIAKARKTAKS